MMVKSQEESQTAMHKLEEKHVHELEENRQMLDQNLPTQPKASAELLNLKKIEEQLAKQKLYAEAHKI